MANKLTVRFTENFQRNLTDLEHYLTSADASQSFDSLVFEMLYAVIPNLERFPHIGRPFLVRATRSVETSNALDRLRAKLLLLTTDFDELREYIVGDYLLLYVQIGKNLDLLAIRHHRQLSFDFDSHWGRGL